MTTKMKETLSIMNAEWKIMRVVWTSGQSISKEIREVLDKHMTWKPSATKTLTGCLAD